MSILLLDFEATNLETSEARIIEIGAQLVTDDFTEVKDELSLLVWESNYPALTPEVLKVTGITQDELTIKGISPARALQKLAAVVNEETRAVIAYNRAYDEQVWRAEVNRHTLTLDAKVSWMSQIPWACALADIETNVEFKSKRLAHVALEYGITVNPKLLHRAIADVELMRQVLVESKVTLEKMFTYQNTPWVYVQANVTYNNKDLAKKAGFGWESAPGDYSGRRWDKAWVKRVKEHKYKDLEQECPFSMKVLAVG